MPTIYKSKRQRLNEGKRKERMQIYNTARWRELRRIKFMNDPLCEMCLKEGVATPADDVHHIQSFMIVDDLAQRKEIAFDYNNLMSLCDKCHQRMHNGHRPR